jgi:copper transport protein
VGQNQFEVYLQDAAGQPVDNASQVSLHFTFLGQSMGTATAEMTPTGEGRYTTAGGYISLIGPWQVEVSIRRPNTFDAFAPFRMEAGLGGTIRPIGSETLLERLTKFLSQSGGSVTGVLLMGLGLGWVFLARRAAKRDWQLVPLLLPGFVALGLGIGQLYIFYDEFTPAKFTTNPILPDSSSIARGKQLYETNCAMCHGVEGQGDGELAANFFPPPVNFTAGHTTTHPDGDVYFWIKEGIEGSAMPAFGKQLSDEEVWHLVNYVRRLSAQQ